MSERRVAIVGAGPAGAFAAARLLRVGGGPDVDLYERLPTPWGLLRGGVAPDHHEIKRLDETFARDVLGPRCRFLGNVEVGTDVAHADLMRHYDAVIYAVGAQTDKSLGIPGEELPGSLPATDFVGWYNGHPDRRELDPPLAGRRAVIIGNGNVAADVARMLTLDPAVLERTDTADHALEALRASGIEEVVVLGRRGPAQAAFTSAELREMGHLDGVDLRVDPAAVELDPVSEEWLEAEGTFTARKNVELLREFAAAGPEGAPRRIELRFLTSPVAIHGDGKVESIELVRNQLEHGGDGGLRAQSTGEHETLECGLVFRSIGYRGAAIEGVPFDDWHGTIPNEEGRIVDPETQSSIAGEYVAGWIKRGPSGVIGTNKRDAQETVEHVLEDLAEGRLADPAEADPDSALALVRERQPDMVAYDGWEAIDAAEKAAGEPLGRPRVKLTSVSELLAAAR